jgi:hypothetical protein
MIELRGTRPQGPSGMWPLWPVASLACGPWAAAADNCGLGKQGIGCEVIFAGMELSVRG